MKFITTQLTYLLGERKTRQHLVALTKFILFLCVVIAIFTVLFHFVMAYEGQDHSWITGFYWTLTVMSTLGFGDITFESDLGRVFSVVVLISGIILLLIMLPFAFIRFAYAPWLEAQVRTTAPRELPESTEGHVLICSYDAIAPGLIERLGMLGIPYCVIESDHTEAAQHFADGIKVLAGERDARATFAAARADKARLVFANLDDKANTNIVLTVRQEAADVPIMALAQSKASIDILELSGATNVVPLTHRLGELLASRSIAGTQRVHTIGRYGDLVFGEFPIHGTTISGLTVRESNIRQKAGVSVVGLWERGVLHSTRADTVLTDRMVAVVVGREEQMAHLDEFFVFSEANEAPVVVIGGGKVGRSAIRALKRFEHKVHVIELDPKLKPYLEKLADRVFIGDAANRAIMDAAGIAEAPSVLLTSNDDATNIYLAAYCRRLSPNVRIVGRITHDRNLESVHRAGVDFALSYATLGVKSVLSVLRNMDFVVLAHGVEVIVEPVPPGLESKTLAEGDIGRDTGLTVVAIRRGKAINSSPSARTELEAGSELIMLGTTEQQDSFRKKYARARA